MTRHRRSAMIALLIISAASSAVFGGDYYIYSPKQVVESQEGVLPVGKEEILVKEILIKKGDTLTKLSRKFSGRGSYYPQILLFNDIKNPDLIYAGDTLKVPAGKERPTDAVRSVTPEEGQPEKKYSATVEPVEQAQLHKPAGRKKMKGRKRSDSKKAEKKPFSSARGTEKSSPAQTASSKTDNDKTMLFEQAVSAYRQNDCTKAVSLFDRFLAKNETSPLAAEASLLKAECLLKLSESR